MKQQAMIYNILKVLAILIILAQTAHAQQRIAILNTEDNGEPQLEFTELDYLTGRLREIAGEVLKGKFGIMDQQSIAAWQTLAGN
ncbi:MAG: hypothetical protein LBH25_10325 [Fibromonadaceae bacterium]|nr:hypothetical protein [Fibromonadaceae bacterium]